MLGLERRKNGCRLYPRIKRVVSNGLYCFNLSPPCFDRFKGFRNENLSPQYKPDTRSEIFQVAKSPKDMANKNNNKKSNTDDKIIVPPLGTYVVVSGQLSKGKLPCLTEDGGGYAEKEQKSPVKFGKATLIAKPDGTPPTAICIPCETLGVQAVIPVYNGYFVVKTTLENGEISHTVYRVYRRYIGENGYCTITLREICKYENDTWDHPLPDKAIDVVNAAEDKVQMHLCRIPMFVVPSEAAANKQKKTTAQKAKK